MLPGITIHADGKTSGGFRLCDGEHDEDGWRSYVRGATAEVEVTRAVGPRIRRA